MNIRLSTNVRYYRLANHMTQQDLASAVGYVHKTSISNIEKGKCDVPLSVISKLSKVFNIKESELLFGSTADSLTPHEHNLVNSYRQQEKSVQDAIDRMLGIEKKHGSSGIKVG